MSLERNLHPLNEKSNTRIMIVLDIDDTLASPVFKDDLDKDYMSWFRENDLIVDAIEKHIIHPGVVEFIRYLYENPNIRFCFFSHGEVKRNDLFVSGLLKRALCDKSYKHCLNENEFKLFEKNIKENNIFSRNDCSKSRGGGYHKDLKTVTLKLGGDLNSTILIDDQRCSLSHGQKHNGLIIRYADDLIYKDTFTKPFFEDSFIEDWCHDNMRSANHIFYLTGLLEKVLSFQTKPITQSLFELQYIEDGEEHLWLEKYGAALVSFKNRESLSDIEILKNISHHHDNVPVLIYLVESKELIIFGKPDAIHWEFISLDLSPSLIDKFNFPQVDAASTLLEQSHGFHLYYEEMALRDEINKKHGHTEINYEPRFDLYDDVSLYLSGLKTLNKFSTTPLEFYGYHANQFFGLDKAIEKNDSENLTNVSGHSTAPANSETVENKGFSDKSRAFSSADTVASVSMVDKKDPETSDSSCLSVKNLRTPSTDSSVRGGSEKLAGTAGQHNPNW